MEAFLGNHMCPVRPFTEKVPKVVSAPSNYKAMVKKLNWGFHELTCLRHPLPRKTAR